MIAPREAVAVAIVASDRQRCEGMSAGVCNATHIHLLDSHVQRAADAAVATLREGAVKRVLKAWGLGHYCLPVESHHLAQEAVDAILGPCR